MPEATSFDAEHGGGALLVELKTTYLSSFPFNSRSAVVRCSSS